MLREKTSIQRNVPRESAVTWNLQQAEDHLLNQLSPGETATLSTTTNICSTDVSESAVLNCMPTSSPAVSIVPALVLFGIAAVILAIFKLVGWINFSWWIITAPAWLPTFTAIAAGSWISYQEHRAEKISKRRLTRNLSMD